MKTTIEVEVNLFRLDIEARDLADYIMNKGNVEYDIEFLDKYLHPFLNSQGLLLEEVEEIVDNLSPRSKEIIKKMAELIK